MVFGDRIAGYPVVRSRRKTLALEMQEDGSLIIRAPLLMPHRPIAAFVDRKRSWIARHQKRIQMRPQYRFVSGELFFVFGQRHPLSIVQRNNCLSGLEFDGKRFLLSEHPNRHPRDLFVAWYKQYGLPVLRDRAMHYADKIGIVPKSVRMSKAKRQWGSCNSKYELRFSWRTSMVPLPVIDAIAAHEVAHLAERNHSRNFYALLRHLCPEYDRHNAWLKDHEHRFMT